MSLEFLTELSSALLAFGVGVLLGFLVSQARQKMTLLREKELHAHHLEEKEYELGALEAKVDDLGEQLRDAGRRVEAKERELLGLVAERDGTIDGLVDELGRKASALKQIKDEHETFLETVRSQNSKAIARAREEQEGALQTARQQKAESERLCVRLREELAEQRRETSGLQRQLEGLRNEVAATREERREHGQFEEGLRRELDRLSSAEASLRAQLAERRSAVEDLQSLFLTETRDLRELLEAREQTICALRNAIAEQDERLAQREAEFEEYRSEFTMLADSLRERDAGL